MNFHIPQADTPRRQLAVIAGKILLITTVVALVVASVVQQHAQQELRKAQHAATAAHNDGACGMRSLTTTLIGRTQAAIARPSTRPEDRAGYQAAISAYESLRASQVTVPERLDCSLVLKRP